MDNPENQVCEIQTFVFFDLETTGFERNSRILELSMVALSREALLGMGKSFSPIPQANSGPPSLPRVLHKLTHFYYPRNLITSFVEQLTGLSNEKLHHLSGFSESSALAITSFLNLPTPVCLIAHNGNSFDFPILKAELMHVNSDDLDVLCADSLLFARQFEANEIKLLTELAQQFNDEDFSDSESNYNIELSNGTSNDLTIPAYKTNGVTINDSNVNDLVDQQSVIYDLKYQPSTSNDSLVNYLSLYRDNLKTPNKQILTSLVTSVTPKKKISQNDSFSTPNHLSLYRDNLITSNKQILISPVTSVTPKKTSQNDSFSTLNHLSLYCENLKTPNKQILTSPVTSVTPKKKNSQNDSFSTPSSQLNQKSQQEPSCLVTRSKAKRNLYPGKKKGMKKPFSQPTLYYRIFRCNYEAHRAECDALALLQICGFHGQDFINWADSNYTQFKSIKPRWNSTRNSFLL